MIHPLRQTLAQIAEIQPTLRLQRAKTLQSVADAVAQGSSGQRAEGGFETRVVQVGSDRQLPAAVAGQGFGFRCDFDQFAAKFLDGDDRSSDVVSFRPFEGIEQGFEE